LTKWNGVCDHAAQIPQLFRTAFRAMTTGRPGSAHLCLPYDVLKQPVDVTDVWAQPGHGACPAWRFVADPAAVAAAGDEIPAARARFSSAAAASSPPARAASCSASPSCSNVPVAIP